MQNSGSETQPLARSIQSAKNQPRIGGLLNLGRAMNFEFLNPFPQRRAGDAQQLRGVDLVVVRLLECLNYEFAFDGGQNFQLRIAAGDLEQLASQGRRIVRRAFRRRG